MFDCCPIALTKTLATVETELKETSGDRAKLLREIKSTRELAQALDRSKDELQNQVRLLSVENEKLQSALRDVHRDREDATNELRVEQLLSSKAALEHQLQTATRQQAESDEAIVEELAIMKEDNRLLTRRVNQLQHEITLKETGESPKFLLVFYRCFAQFLTFLRGCFKTLITRTDHLASRVPQDAGSAETVRGTRPKPAASQEQRSHWRAGRGGRDGSCGPAIIVGVTAQSERLRAEAGIRAGEDKTAEEAVRGTNTDGAQVEAAAERSAWRRWVTRGLCGLFRESERRRSTSGVEGRQWQWGAKTTRQRRPASNSPRRGAVTVGAADSGAGDAAPDGCNSAGGLNSLEVGY
ncbi:hypothetical protein BC937DRAFT_90740 [Endogone sp. FLAS-F59071]|nr:hypothetical protein BC937DRAFT_90740 [Endogone sp. FLAS-F59071]|eukprot:RUS21980.1 hypothetical protein BC937DRAFT_90740 [Endogone sp. FLAS-F59071]